MKVLLINPPLISSETPYASIPELAGFLKSKSINVRSLDLNIEFIRTIISKPFLLKTKLWIDDFLKDPNFINEGVSSKYQLSYSKIQELKKLINSFLVENKESMNLLINQSDFLYDELRMSHINRNFKKKTYVSSAIQILAKFAFLPYFPEKVQLEPFFVQKNSLYEYNYDDLLDFTSNTKRNIYIDFFEKQLCKIKEYDADIIVITVPHVSNFFPAMTLARILKYNLKSNVVLGGIYISTVADTILKHSDIFSIFCDAVISDRNRSSLFEYINAIQTKTDFSKVSQLIYLSKDKLLRNPYKPSNDDNLLQLPDYDDFNLNLYSTEKINIRFLSGCYWGNCSFCYTEKIKNTDNSLYVNAVDILESLQLKYGISSFCIVDDAVNPMFLNYFVDEIINRNLKINYTLYLRFEKDLTFSFLKKLKKSGVGAIFFGLESASQNVLNSLNKGIKLDTVKRIILDCKKLGIFIKVGVIYGIPSETENDLLQTINFIRKYQNDSCVFSLNPFVLLKNSNICKNNYVKEMPLQDVIDKEEFASFLYYKLKYLDNEKINNLFLRNGLKKVQKDINW